MQEFVLSEQSKSFREWKNPSVELYLDIYLFNWTNYEKFSDQKEYEKPIFEELGPYRFRETRDKINIHFNENNSTVTYNPISYYTFDAEGSNGTLDDIVTNLNIAAIGAAGQSSSFDYKKRKIISWAINAYDQELTTSKTVRELLFEGYEDDMLSAGKAGIVENFDMSHIPYDKIGWFYMVI
jgi:hypothetical protein